MTRTAIRWILVFNLIPALFAAPAGNLENAGPTLSAAQKEAIVDEISKLMNESYVYPDKAKQIEERLRSRLAGGAYKDKADAREFAMVVAHDILEVSKDRHTGFVFDPKMADGIRRMKSRNEDEVRQERERQLEGARSNNFGFRKVERMAGNIGYMDFRGFGDARSAGPTAIAALNFLGYCDALIIDLRQNGGGDPTLIQLISSYFFPEPAHLNDIYTRTTDSTENFWTLPFVPGPRMENVDLYVLTSARTFSGAEEFCYNLKNLKRATLVGEKTGGGAHPTEPKVVQQNFILRVPFAKAINPITKTNWEGTGVTPDVQVPAAEAFDRAYTIALEKLSAKTTDAQKKAEYEWNLVGQRARLSPPNVPEKNLGIYVGEYGERKIALENGVLVYQRTGPRLRLTPLTETLFSVEGLEFFRVEFVVKDGRAVELVGLYDNGEREPSKRTR